MKNKLTITKYYDNEDYYYTKPVLSSLYGIFQSNTYLNNISFLKYNKNIGLIKINCIVYEINNIPDNIRIDGYLYLSGCKSLTHLPDNLKVNGGLDLSNCTSLTYLPDNLTVNGWLSLSNCTSLTHLPDNLTVNDDLYLKKCTSLKISKERYKKLQKQVTGKIYK